MEVLLDCIFEILIEILFYGLGEWFTAIIYKKIAMKIQNRYLRWMAGATLIILTIAFAIGLAVAIVIGIDTLWTLFMETFMY